MLIQKPNLTSSLVPFTSATIDHLWQNGSSGCGIAGVSTDGSYGWVAKGASLEVFNINTGERLAAWHFGVSTREGSCTINGVSEFGKDRSARQLVVGTSSGLVCLFDVNMSTVIKVIRLSFNVSAVETVSFNGPDAAVSAVLSKHLSCFNGIVAVGTMCGHIYLIDMCLDDNHSSSEMRPNGVDMLDPTLPVTAARRSQAASRRCHLCLELGEATTPTEDSQFHYTKPSGEVSQSLDPTEVCVSCIKFIKHTGYLVVGFNFGCFQLWKLSIPVLEFSSRYGPDVMAVVKLAYQEPENDPKHYGYLWVVRGPMPTESISKGTSCMTLYQLGFSSKVWINHFGYLLEELVGVWIRFEHELHAAPYTAVDEIGAGSRLFACYTIENQRYCPPPTLPENDQSLDERYYPDLNLCMFAWEAVSTGAKVGSQCFVAIFDMNRWYNAQIPSSIRDSTGPYDTCSYMAVWSLDDVISVTSPDPLLTIHISYENLRRFKASAISTSDQLCKYIQPTSLGFKMVCVCESGVIDAQCLGIQRQVLTEVQSNGSTLLLNVNDLYAACVSFGLLPGPIARTVSMKREAVLQMALDHGMIGFVTSCIAQWSSVEFMSEGCTMRFLLDWAWSVVVQLKESVDKLCEPLYDFSRRMLSPEDMHMLSHYQITFGHLKTIFKSFAEQSLETTEQGQHELSDRLLVVHMISDYLDAVLWFYEVGFLPEFSEDDELEVGEYAFPYRKLSNRYSKCRNNVTNMRSGKSSEDQLMIDKLLSKDAPDVLDMFEDKCLSRFYPPSSFQAVLNIFLLTDVSMRIKHFIVLYVITDLINVADNEAESQSMEQRFSQFSKAFSVTPSLCKYVKAVWLLDHGFHQKASVALLNTTLHEEITDWQYTEIISAFLNQGHCRMALTFMTLKNEWTLKSDDIGLRLKVLQANGLTVEALEYQRSCHARSTCKELMSLMIQSSLQTNSVEQLLQLPLTSDEERHLVEFLSNSSNPCSQDLLVLYYLQQSKIVDAIHLSLRRDQTSGAPYEFEKVRQLIVEGYKQTLPSVQRKLVSNPGPMRMNRTMHHEYDRPVPLSATLFMTDKSKVITRSRLLSAVLDKVKELKPRSANSIEEPESESDFDCSKNPASILFGTPVVPPSSGRRRSRMVLSDVVFPSITHGGVASSSMAYATTPSRRILEVRSSTASIVSRNVSALSLLQTPPVVRKHPVQMTASRIDVLPVPQSILSARVKGVASSVSKSSTRLTWHDATIFSPEYAGKPLANSTVSCPNISDETETSPGASSSVSQPQFSLFDTDLFAKSEGKSVGKSKLQFTNVTSDVEDDDSWLSDTFKSKKCATDSCTVASACTVSPSCAMNESLSLLADDDNVHMDIDEEIVFKTAASKTVAVAGSSAVANLTDGIRLEAGHRQIVVSNSSMNEYCDQAATSVGFECQKSALNNNSNILAVMHGPVVTASSMYDLTIEPEVEPSIADTTETGVPSSISNGVYVSSASHDLVSHTSVTDSASVFTGSTVEHVRNFEMQTAGIVEMPDEDNTDTLRRPPLWNDRPPSVCQESGVSVPVGKTNSQSAEYSVSTGSADLHLQLSDDDTRSDVLGSVENGVAAESVEAATIERSCTSVNAFVESSTNKVTADVLLGESDDPNEQVSCVSVVSDVESVTDRGQKFVLSTTAPESEQQLKLSTTPPIDRKPSIRRSPSRSAVTPQRRSNRHLVCDESENPPSTTAVTPERTKSAFTKNSKLQVTMETNETSVLVRTDARMSYESVDKGVYQLITSNGSKSVGYSSTVTQIADDDGHVSDQLTQPDSSDMPDDLNANRLRSMQVTPPKITTSISGELSVLPRTPPRTATTTEQQGSASITQLTPTRHSQRLQARGNSMEHAIGGEVEKPVSRRKNQTSKKPTSLMECEVEPTGETPINRRKSLTGMKPVNLIDSEVKQTVRTPTRRKSEVITTDAKAVATDEVCERPELQLTPRRSSRFASRSENELEPTLSPSRSTRQSSMQINIEGSELSRKRTLSTSNIVPNLDNLSSAKPSTSRRRSRSMSTVAQPSNSEENVNDTSSQRNAVPWSSSTNEMNVDAYDPVTAEPVESRPLTPMSDHHSESSFHERTSFVFSMPANITRLPAGEVAESDSSAASQPPSNSAGVPFFFSPPAYRTRGKKSTAVVPQQNTLQPSSAKVTQAAGVEPVTKNSKRFKKERSEHDGVILLTPPTPAAGAAAAVGGAKLTSVTRQRQAKKKTRTSTVKMRW